MTKPVLRVAARAASLPARDSPAPIAAAPDSDSTHPYLMPVLPVFAAPHSAPDFAHCLRLAQLEYLEVQQRLSNLMALAQMQHPGALRSSAVGPGAALGFASLSNTNPCLQFAPQTPRVVLPPSGGSFLDQMSMLRCFGPLQLNANLAPDQELMLSLAATQYPNAAYAQQLWPADQSQLQLIAQLRGNQRLSSSGLER